MVTELVICLLREKKHITAGLNAENTKIALSWGYRELLYLAAISSRFILLFCLIHSNKFISSFEVIFWLVLGQTHYKMISCNIWLPVVIHRSKTRNNALDVFWGIETIIMPLSRQPQKKSFCPVSHSLAPTFMKIFFIMRLPCGLSE